MSDGTVTVGELGMKEGSKIIVLGRTVEQLLYVFIYTCKCFTLLTSLASRLSSSEMSGWGFISLTLHALAVQKAVACSSFHYHYAIMHAHMHTHTHTHVHMYLYMQTVQSRVGTCSEATK